MRLLGKLLARFSKRWARVSQQLGQIELEMAMEESGQLPKRQLSHLQVSILWSAIGLRVRLFHTGTVSKNSLVIFLSGKMLEPS